MEDHNPSISQTAFCCPHCGAYTTQYWYNLGCEEIEKETKIPFIPDEDMFERIRNRTDIDDDTRTKWKELTEKYLSKDVHRVEKSSDQYYRDSLININVSQCYNCHKFSVWIHKKLVYPIMSAVIIPNIDLPDDIKNDFEEARKIVNDSPRGSAALLRLCIQKLCKYLGEKGQNIDDDIANLVKKGLNPIIQKSLDIVRVIGNEAVHPGSLDLKDDYDTSISLFSIVNSIAEQMITHPKMVQSMYDELPISKRKAIERRDKR
jgi:hypothetical protein